MGQYLGRQKPIAVSGQKNSRFSGEEACNFYIVMQRPSVSSTFYKWILKFSLLVHGTRVALPADGREEITEFPPTLAGFWQLEYSYEIGLAWRLTKWPVMPTGPQLRVEVSLILRVVANCFERKETSSMKRVAIVLTVGLIAGLLAGHQKAFAQGGQVEISSAGAPSSDLPMADLQAFDQFRAAHPEIVHALSRNPKLIDSKSFQDKHPALRDYLSAHSGFEAAFEEDPGNFIPPSRGMGAAHHRHHKAAEGGGGPEAAGSPAGAEGGGAASSAATPAASGSTGGH